MASKKATTQSLSATQQKLIRAWVLLTTNPTFVQGFSTEDAGTVADKMKIPPSDPARPKALALIRYALDSTPGVEHSSAGSTRETLSNVRSMFQTEAANGQMGWVDGSTHPGEEELALSFALPVS